MFAPSTRFVRRTMVTILALIAWCAAALATNVQLAWDPNTDSDLAGYKVYYGTVSGSYGTTITVGNQTTYTVTGLPAGTYYFVVTAYNTAGIESGFSNEVSTIITGGAGTSACDLNGDGAINVLDLQVLIKVILGTQTMPGKGDFNADGHVNVLDLQILANVILGLRSCPL